MSASIFISFASQDRKVANTLCQALEGRGFKCWISSRDILPGENFQVAIVRAIRKAKLMLLVFTANSNNSAEMNKELALASQQKLTVVPLRIEDVAPNDAFAYEFATRQWIDFFADWELAMNALASQIANVLGPEDMVEAEAPAVAARTVAAPVLAPVEPEAAEPALPVAEAPSPPPAVIEPEPEPIPEPEPVATVVAPPAPEPVVEAPKPAPPPPPPKPVEPVRAAASAPAAAPAKTKSSPLPLVIGVVVVLAAAAAAAYFLMGQKASAPPPATSSAAPAASSAAPTVTLAPAPAAPAGAPATAAPATASPSASPAIAPSEGDTAATAATTAAPEKHRRQPKTSGAGAGAPSRASRSDVPY